MSVVRVVEPIVNFLLVVVVVLLSELRVSVCLWTFGSRLVCSVMLLVLLVMGS